jgi:hypothetical protein
MIASGQSVKAHKRTVAVATATADATNAPRLRSRLATHATPTLAGRPPVRLEVSVRSLDTLVGLSYRRGWAQRCGKLSQIGGGEDDQARVYHLRVRPGIDLEVIAPGGSHVRG